ncbi:MAG: PLP-dependent transferase [Ignavibacteria bacterium]|jgi:cystathionine gamma-synthase|nr:PLP-dependent transferase [Ignavibacteria bacterium]
MEYFCHIPCGDSLPQNNPHAVSVSLPKISDVVGYEESDPSVLEIMHSAYPRFRQNLLVQKARDYARKNFSLTPEDEVIPVSSSKSVSLFEKQTGHCLETLTFEGLDFIKIPKDSPLLEGVKYFQQHTGLILSSRKAEDFLLKNKIVLSEFPEKREDSSSAAGIIKKTLSEAYGNVAPEDVFLCTSGTNAFYTAFEALRVKRSEAKRNIIVQLGWLYLDSMEIIRKYSNKHSICINIADLDSLEQYIKENHSEIACVITEIPTNPLIQTADLPRLSSLTRNFNIPLMIDSTIATPFNVELMEYADVVVESLTKYACGHADVMMGAVMLNKNSNMAQSIKEALCGINEIPYIKDICRLAEEIKFYSQRVEAISENTLRFISYLKSSAKIKHVHWALEESTECNYRKIMKNGGAVPGLISVIFDKDLQHYYDRLPLAKGPSFGTEFTLAMPYIYMAHYDMLKTPRGRARLNNLGIDRQLLRISVGLEPSDELIRVFEEL